MINILNILGRENIVVSTNFFIPSNYFRTLKILNARTILNILNSLNTVELLEMNKFSFSISTKYKYISATEKSALMKSNLY